MFTDVLNFLKENWQIILDVAAILFSIVFCIIRKRPVKVVDTLKEWIQELLPDFINQAEEKYGSGHGEDKLRFVLLLVKLAFEREGQTFTGEYKRYVSFLAEQILSTPQKK